LEHELRTPTALLRLGVDDVLAWAPPNCTKSLANLNKELAAGVAPVELEHFMGAECGPDREWTALNNRMVIPRWQHLRGIRRVLVRPQGGSGFT
jgi:hypothetical protein